MLTESQIHRTVEAFCRDKDNRELIMGFLLSNGHVKTYNLMQQVRNTVDLSVDTPIPSYVKVPIKTCTVLCPVLTEHPDSRVIVTPEGKLVEVSAPSNINYRRS